MNLKKKITVNLGRLFRNHTYTSKHGLAKGLKRRGGLAFLPSFIPRSTEMLREEIFIEGLDFTGKTVYDIGGDQGIYTLFFARKVGTKGRVFTFEPNPVSFQHIVTNVGLNDFSHVDVRNIALGDETGKLIFAYLPNDPGTGSADALIREQILKQPGAQQTEVPVETLDNLISRQQLPKPDFAKIDVEGLELNVLRGMKTVLREHRPELFIEIHGADMQAKSENIARVANFLFDLDYQIHHVESNQSLSRETVDVAREGHIYCT